MKFFYTIVLLGVGVSAIPAEASVPHVVVPKSETDMVVVEDIDLQQTFHGALEDFPHTYEISSGEPFVLKAEVLVPDIDSSQNIFSGIIIKLPEKSGRVTEIDRMLAEEGVWESRFNSLSGDTYRHGPSFEEEVEKGTYRIQIYTPDNIGKYALTIGSREDKNIGYFALLGRLIDVKRFFEKSPLMVVQSPLVYVPLLILGILVVVYRIFRTKRSAQINSDIV